METLYEKIMQAIKFPGIPVTITKGLSGDQSLIVALAMNEGDLAHFCIQNFYVLFEPRYVEEGGKWYVSPTAPMEPVGIYCTNGELIDTGYWMRRKLDIQGCPIPYTRSIGTIRNDIVNQIESRLMRDFYRTDLRDTLVKCVSEKQYNEIVEHLESSTFTDNVTNAFLIGVSTNPEDEPIFLPVYVDEAITNIDVLNGMIDFEKLYKKVLTNICKEERDAASYLARSIQHDEICKRVKAINDNMAHPLHTRLRMLNAIQGKVNVRVTFKNKEGNTMEAQIPTSAFTNKAICKWNVGKERDVLEVFLGTGYSDFPYESVQSISYGKKVIFSI